MSVRRPVRVRAFGALARHVASVCAVVLAASLLAVAQAPKPAPDQSQMMLVTFTKVHVGTAAQEYLDLQIKEVIPAQKKGGSLGRQAWSSGIAGPPGEFVYMSPISSMAQFDSPSPLTKALGEQGAADLNSRLAKVSAPLGTAVVRTRPDLSYIPDPKTGPAPLALITIVDVIPGRRIEFENFIKKDVMPVMQQAKVRSYRVFEVVFGEHTGGYVSAVEYDTYASIGKGHPFQIVLGEDGARKLEAKAGGLVTKIQRFVSRYRPELSWTPAGTSND